MVESHPSSESISRRIFDVITRFAGPLKPLFKRIEALLNRPTILGADNLDKSFLTLMQYTLASGVEVGASVCCGPVRNLNQDRIGISSEDDLVILCDGMSPEGAMVANTVTQKLLENPDDIPEAAKQAHRGAQLCVKVDGGTTLVCANVVSGIDTEYRLEGFYAGDSQIVVGRKRMPLLISPAETKQNSYIDEGYNRDRLPPDVSASQWDILANVLSNSIQAREESFRLNPFSQPVQSGDWFIVGSDGLFDVFSPEECLILLESCETSSEGLAKLTAAMNFLWANINDIGFAPGFFIMKELPPGFTQADLDIINEKKVPIKQDNGSIIVGRIP